MTGNQVELDLVYASLQLAAEAIFDVRHNAKSGDQITPPGGKIETRWLTDGNDHSSKFTQHQADDFVKNWALFEHEANTATGFGGTLFKYSEFGS
jgi:hypothetical protein